MLSSTGGYPTGPYAVAFARVDGAAGLPGPAPGRGPAPRSTIGADRFAVCFSIPADEHAAREIFTYRRTVGHRRRPLSVFDGTGLRYCGPTGPSIDRTFTCSLPAGPATVILEADAVDATYQLTHRDASTPAP